MRRKGGGRWQDEAADSGAETAGSEYSCVSSSSSELSVDDVQDPFLLSMHLIADPGASGVLQQAIDSLLAWIHPDLQLFRVSERRKPRKPDKAITSQPALAVILFLKEEYDEEPILRLHESFQRPPWHYHHTEQVHGNFLPYMPGGQDFFTLAQGTPLWAIRPVHYGKEIVRFTIYCRNERFASVMKLYELVLRRRVCQKKAGFCVFPVYSNVDIDIQLSLKRLPKGHVPSPTESAVLEFRVKDIERLIPLLPNPCSQISEGRWQTEDPDGNKILLQQARYRKCGKLNKFCSPSPARHFPVTPLPSFLPQSSRWTLSKASDPSKPVYSIAFHHASLCFGVSQQDLRNHNQALSTGKPGGASSDSGSFQRSKSLACLPTMSSSLVPRSFHFSEPNSLSTFSSGHRTRSRVNIDDLEGVQETDVDTGMKLAFADLSVVSAYSVSDGFSNDEEAKAKDPVEEQSVKRFKKPGSRGRSPPAKCNIFGLSSSSLPFPLDWFSSSSESHSGSPSAGSFEIKCLPGGTVLPFADSRTTGGGKNNEEEFYI